MSDATQAVPPTFTPKAPPGAATTNRTDLHTTITENLTTHVVNDNQVYTRKVLGQVQSAATNLATLYTVPASTQVEVAGIYCANTGSGAAVIRISIAIAGATDDIKQYILHDLPLAGHESIVLDTGIVLAATDVIRCQSDTGGVSFTAMGTQITAAP